jgi:hypothetical protein
MDLARYFVLNLKKQPLSATDVSAGTLSPLIPSIEFKNKILRQEKKKKIRLAM